MEERDERLVGRRDEHELEWVAIECDTLQGIDDGVEDSPASNYTSGQCDCQKIRYQGRHATVSDTAHGLVGEDSVLPKVGPSTSLLDESGRKTVGVGDVVD